MAYEYLPLEILRKIFLYLNVPDRLSASAVCQQWYRAVLDGRPYDDMRVVLQGDMTRGMNILAKSSRTFYGLVIKDGDKEIENRDFWENVGPHLRRLEFRECGVSERVFLMVLGYCSKLEGLCISRCDGLLIPGKLLESPEHAPGLCSSLENVRDLDLSDNSYLSDADFNRIVSVVGKLENLSLAGCQMSFHPGIYKRFYPNGRALSSSVLTFQTVVEYIERANIKLKRANFSRTLLDNKAVQRLAAACADSLTELSLVSCVQLSHAGILSLCRTLPGLEVLDLAENYHVTDLSLASICDTLTQLRELDMTRCRLLTSHSVAEIARLQRLRALSLSSCCKVSSAGFVEALCSNSRPGMKRLDVSYCNIDTYTVVALAKSLPNLTHLDLTSCPLLTDEAVHVISQNMRRLICLRMAGCETVTDNGICSDRTREDGKTRSKSLALLESLEELNLRGCKHLSDDGLGASVRFVGLRHLDLSLCQKLTDVGLACIGSHNPSLEHLVVSKCILLTDFGVIGTLERLSRLRHLDVQGCPKVTDAALHRMSRCGALRYLNVSLCGVTLHGVSLLEDSAARLTVVYRT
ncbi:F-box/LRR-repeat protein 2-like [Ornithodoros turicata]|uniref:F-box/LRR-repeat protein 2-like n=1 Tax=Ornithodoros turicata TaxID=34597 RepID=UPI00313934EF